MALGCDAATPRYLRMIGGCTVRSDEQVEQGLRELRLRLIAIVEVQRRAPRAQMVVVNYPAILPDSGTCERLGLSVESVAQMRAVAAELARVTREAAEDQRALLMDAMRLTQGHDVCAAGVVDERHAPGARPAGCAAAPHARGHDGHRPKAECVVGEVPR